MVQEDDTPDRGRHADEHWTRVGPMTAALMVANAGGFVALTVDGDLIRTLGLTPDAGAVADRPWTPVSVLFTSASVLHVVAALAVIYFFGGALERRLGPLHLLAIYVLSGVAGSAAMVVGAGLGAPQTALGASAAFLGLIAALAVRPSDPPLARLQLRRLVLVLLVVNALAPVVVGDWGSSLAHVAGMAVGAAYGYRQASAAAGGRSGPSGRHMTIA